MTPAEAKNLRTLVGELVQVTFHAPDDDWPYYRLLDIDASDSTIKLRGADYPAHLGGHKHDGDEFWCDWEGVKDVVAIVIRRCNAADMAPYVSE